MGYQLGLNQYWIVWEYISLLIFLALLDYISRAHEIEICPSSVRPSVCGIDYLWSYCMDFFQILVVASPGPYARTFFEFLKKKIFLIFYEYFSFSLTWDPREENFKTLLLLQIAAESSQTFPEYSS